MDRRIASVGTENLDLRSFDLNFEVATLIYDEKIAQKMAVSFYEDLKHSEQITPARWENRSNLKRIKERLIRLISPFM